MPREYARSGRVRIKSQRQNNDLFKVRRSFWDIRISTTRKTALFGFLIGITLGCLFGTTMGILPSGAARGNPEMLSVNQRTGKPQLHIKGKPEIK